MADVQTGFGPFVAVYLTTQKWTQVEIGLVLSIGGLVGLTFVFLLLAPAYLQDVRNLLKKFTRKAA